MSCRLTRNGIVLISNIRVADTILERMKGLMLSRDLGDADGLLIDPCNSIHTFFMNYDLDIVFLSAKNEVVKVIRKMKPWRVTKIYFKSAKVLEIMGGTLPHDIKVGDRLELLCTN